jgi:hypothetical protein
MCTGTASGLWRTCQPVGGRLYCVSGCGGCVARPWIARCKRSVSSSREQVPGVLGRQAADQATDLDQHAPDHVAVAGVPATAVCWAMHAIAEVPAQAGQVKTVQHREWSTKRLLHSLN